MTDKALLDEQTELITTELAKAVDNLLDAADHVQNRAIAAINELVARSSAPQEPDDDDADRSTARCASDWTSPIIEGAISKHRRAFPDWPVSDAMMSYARSVGTLMLLAEHRERIANRLQAKAPETGEEWGEGIAP